MDTYPNKELREYSPHPHEAEKEKTNAKGRALLRIARELRELLDLSLDTDPDVKSIREDIETLEETGRWLSLVTPITCDVIPTNG